MFSYFDHTADLGMRVESDSLELLLADAGIGLTAMLVERPERIAAKTESEIRITALNLEYLFFDWLNELLYQFESDRRIAAGFPHIQVRDEREAGGHLELTATVIGDEFRPTEHLYGHEVKAITYHGLTIERVGDQWVAEVIVDI
mgnify:CR=1 FL=1